METDVKEQASSAIWFRWVVDYPLRCYRVVWACHLTDGDGDEFHAAVLLTFPWAEKRPGANLGKCGSSR